MRTSAPAITASNAFPPRSENGHRARGREPVRARDASERAEGLDRAYQGVIPSVASPMRFGRGEYVAGVPVAHLRASPKSLRRLAPRMFVMSLSLSPPATMPRVTLRNPLMSARPGGYENGDGPARPWFSQVRGSSFR